METRQGLAVVGDMSLLPALRQSSALLPDSWDGPSREAWFDSALPKVSMEEPCYEINTPGFSLNGQGSCEYAVNFCILVTLYLFSFLLCSARLSNEGLLPTFLLCSLSLQTIWTNFWQIIWLSMYFLPRWTQLFPNLSHLQTLASTVLSYPMKMMKINSCNKP